MQAQGTAPPARCDACGGLLQPVAVKTVKHLLDFPMARALQGGRFMFCSDRECDVVYVGFAESGDPEVCFRKEDIKARANLLAGPDEQFACFCFGYTVAEIREDSPEGSIARAIASEIRAGNCACDVMNPSGH